MLARLLRPSLLLKLRFATARESQLYFAAPWAARSASSDGGNRLPAASRHQTARTSARARSAVASFAAVRGEADAPSDPAAAGGGLRLPLLHCTSDAQHVYESLHLDDLKVGMPGRVRQHVNPFRRDLQQVPAPVDWSQIFADPNRPLVLDIGSASGRWLLALARDGGLSGHNFMGFEIRGPHVDRAMRWTKELGIEAFVHFRLANATVALENLLSTYPGRLELAAVQCPDPQFKTRWLCGQLRCSDVLQLHPSDLHHKRRIVQPNLARALADRLGPGSNVYLTSDVYEVAEDMRHQFETHTGSVLSVAPQHDELPTFDRLPAYSLPQAPGRSVDQQPAASPDQSAAEQQARPPSEWAKKKWLVDPLLLPTERELLVLKQGLPMYRLLLSKPNT